MNEAEYTYKNAFSIQSMPEGRIPKYIGSIEKEDGWIYEYYKDQTGDYWFKIYVRKDGQVMTLHEAVHGKVIRRKASHK